LLPSVSYRSQLLTKKRLHRLLRAFREERAGVSVAEYGLLLGLVAVVLVVTVNLAGTKVKGFFDRATCAVYGGCSGAASPAGGGGGGGGGNNGGGNNTGTSNNGGGNNTGGSGG
jgi:Flp pilus assembly pilin Flp